MKYSEASYECSAPTSAYSLLTASGRPTDSLVEDAVFTTEITVDELLLSAKHLYIRFHELKAATTVLLNGKILGKTSGVRAQLCYSVKDALVVGKNKLEIIFSGGTAAWEAGIFAPVTLIPSNSAIVDRVSLTQKHEDGSVTLGINLKLLGDSESVRAVATLVSCTGQIYYGGLTRGKGSIVLRDPLYWCPRGFGVQNLYRLTVNLYGENEIEDSVEMRIGLRTATTVDGAVIVNGMKVLPMGAAHYPDRVVDFAGRDKKLDAFITSAAMANYNCIVIPHNASRPPVKLYELCDIHGIMVIEELATFGEDRIDTLERTSHHACLLAVDLVGGGDGEISSIKAACPDLAIQTLNTHPAYSAFPSLPTFRTLKEKITESELNLFSHSLEAISSTEHISKMLMAVAKRYPYPKDLSDFTYVSGLAAAESVSERVRRARLSTDNRERAVFHTLGDESVFSSHSAIDCNARWKPLQYYSLRGFAPIALYADEKDGKVSFHISNLRAVDLIGSVEYRIVDSANITVYKSSEPCEVAAFSSAHVLTCDLNEYIGDHRRDYYLEYYVKESANYLSKGTLLFVPEKHFRFKKPTIKAEVTGSDRRYSIVLSTDCFVKDLEVSFEGVDAVFSENYVDLTSSAPIKITFNVIGASENAYHLNSVLKLRSIYDIAN